MLTNIYSELWVDKYKPKKLEEIQGQKLIIDQLKLLVFNKNIPHLLFVGPPGVGKTATSVAIARELYLNDWKDNFLELNASDERGIETVRTKIKQFAKTLPLGVLSYKLIFLDEADALTIDAQTALRRILEQYSSNCRFIFSCNFVEKIIKPIQSRCVMFKFFKLNDEEIFNYINMITKLENIKLSLNSINSIIMKANGDLRKALTLTQLISMNKDTKEQDEIIDSITCNSYNNIIKEIINEALNGNFRNSYILYNNFKSEVGISSYDILINIYNILPELNVDEK